MLTERLFEYSVAIFFAAVVLFNIAYFFIVLPRLTSSGVKLGAGDFFKGGQSRCVSAYLALLNEIEARRRYNVALRWSRRITFVIWAVAMVSVWLIYRQA